MAEPTSTTVAAVTTIAAANVITAFGVSIGLRADILIAGFSGSIISIIFFNKVPSTGDTWPHLIRTTMQRMLFVLASSLTAGYLTPVALLLTNIPDVFSTGAACAIGYGAKDAITFVIRRLTGKDGAS